MIVVAQDCYFYFYHWLDQGLFVQLAMTVVATLASLNRELKQWRKYLIILYSSSIRKLQSSCPVAAWMQQNNLPEPDKLNTISGLSVGRPQSPPPECERPDSASTSASASVPIRPQRAHCRSVPDSRKKTRNDEIDDIFDRL